MKRYTVLVDCHLTNKTMNLYVSAASAMEACEKAEREAANLADGSLMNLDSYFAKKVIED